MGEPWEDIADRYADVTDDVRRHFLHPALEDAVAEDVVTWGALLDYGCGPGEVAASLAGRFERVVAVDIASGARRHARQRLGAGAEVLSPHDWRATAGEVDAVVLALVLTTLPRDADVCRLLAEITARLTDGGRLFVATTHPCFTFRALSQVPYRALDAAYEVPIEAGLTVTEYHRPLGALLDAVASAGLRVVRTREVYDDAAYYTRRSEPPHRFAGELPMFLILTCAATSS